MVEGKWPRFRIAAIFPEIFSRDRSAFCPPGTFGYNALRCGRMKTSIQSSLRGVTFVFAASLAATLAAQTPDTSSTPASTPAPMPATDTPATTTDNSKLAHHDKAFLEKAAKGGMKEVAVSQAVLPSLMIQQVKDFANMMINDHTAANNELMSLAMAKGVTLPPADPKLAEKWSDKSGNVDKKYINEMIDDHESTVKLFEKGARGDDQDVVAFAVKTLPTIQHHLQMAKDLKKTLSM
jgi:putative membrane protein